MAKPDLVENQETETEIETKTEKTAPENSEAVEKPGGNGAQAADIRSIAGKLADGMPEVQTHVVDNLKSKSDDVHKNAQIQRDIDGTLFNPSLHKTKKDGSPTITKLGRFVKRPLKQRGEQIKAEIQKPQEEKQKARNTGKAFSRMYVGLNVRFFGADYIPIVDTKNEIDEQAYLDGLFADFFEAKNYSDISPGTALTIGLLSYYMPRFNKPSTANFFKRAWNNCRALWYKWRGKKQYTHNGRENQEKGETSNGE